MKRTNSTGWSGEEQSRFVLFRAPIVHREREIHGQEEQSHQTKRGRNGANFRWGVKNYYGKPTVSGAILGTFAPRSSKLSGPTFRHLAQHQRLIPGRGTAPGSSPAGGRRRKWCEAENLPARHGEIARCRHTQRLDRLLACEQSDRSVVHARQHLSPRHHQVVRWKDLSNIRFG